MNTHCSEQEDHAPHAWGDLNWCPGRAADQAAMRAFQLNPSTEALARVNAYLDDWEASYGMDTPPAHWGITRRITDLRAAAQTAMPQEPSEERAG